ncbi:MAG: Rpn family recombination-promoting nuclease/putative transposase [Clostridiaceae bacterium]
MVRGLLDPKVDFVFKNIFGSEKHPQILISFLNATLKPQKLITHVEIKNTEVQKQYIEDKFSRLDVKATTSNEEIINIEIQLKNEYNMIKRSLYYLSKMYEEQLNEGEDYNLLVKTVCINIVNFKCLTTKNFHTAYRFKEINTNEELTDIQEIHFIEIPKLEDNRDEKDMLVAWTEFLKNPESERVINLEAKIKEIKEAKVELARISSDETQREIYEMREKTLKDKVSALNQAERKGMEIGLKEGERNKAIDIAKNLLNFGMDIDTISKSTGLSIEEITLIKKE